MMETRQLVTSDGTRITYYVAGRPGAPEMVLCNGLGGNVTSWRPLIRYFGAYYRIYCWDYRGLFLSGDAPAMDRYTIAHHADDLRELIAQESIAKPILVGWSMGVQVILELMRSHPRLASAFVAVNGTPGKPFDTAFDTDFLARNQRVFRFLSTVRRHWKRAWRFRPLWARQVVMRGFIRGMRLTRIAAEQMDEGTFVELMAAWMDNDIGNYATIFEELALHDAADVLPDVEIPSLMIAGDADLFTPAHRSEMMASAIPDSELFVIPGGTHFCPYEFPELINMRLMTFVRDRGLLRRRPALRLVRAAPLREAAAG